MNDSIGSMEEPDLNENDFHKTNDAALGSIISEFETEAKNDELGSDASINNTTDQNAEGDNASEEHDELGIPLSDILELLPPDTVDGLLSPTLSIYKVSLSKSLDKETYAEIESLLKSNGNYNEIKRKAIFAYAEEKFPNIKAKKVSPLIIFLTLDLIQTSKIASQVNNYVNEKNHLHGGKHYGNSEEFTQD